MKETRQKAAEAAARLLRLTREKAAAKKLAKEKADAAAKLAKAKVIDKLLAK